VRIGDIDFGQAVIHWPQVMNRLASMHQNYQGTLAPNEVDQELEKCIDSKGLVTIRTDIYELGGQLSSYMLRTGSTNIAALRETILDHEDIEYIGTLKQVSYHERAFIVERTHMSNIRMTYL
jgi:hypothetical protein